jgi:hypothetical protein
MNVGRRILFCAILLAGQLCLAIEDADLPAKLQPAAPFSNLRMEAASRRIPVEGIDPPRQGSVLYPNDSVTALVTLHQKNHPLTQWLVYFQAMTNSIAVSTNPPKPMVMYSSTGHQFEFKRSPAKIRIQTVGPFIDPKSNKRQPSCEDDDAEVSVNQALLGLGLDRGAAAAVRWNEFVPETERTNFMRSFTFSGRPFSSARINHDEKLAEAVHVTAEEERGVVGWIPALQSYFNTVQETPDLESMMRKVVSPPSIWSLVRHLGMRVSIGISYHSAKPFPATGWNFPARLPIYSLGSIVQMNDHTALELTLISAAPRPPLLTCGGIIGFLAQNPDDKENYLTLRVISAHCAPAVKN